MHCCCHRVRGCAGVTSLPSYVRPCQICPPADLRQMESGLVTRWSGQCPSVSHPGNTNASVEPSTDSHIHQLIGWHHSDVYKKNRLSITDMDTIVPPKKGKCDGVRSTVLRPALPVVKSGAPWQSGGGIGLLLRQSVCTAQRTLEYRWSIDLRLSQTQFGFLTS